MFWLVEYVSELINRFKKHTHDELTTYYKKFGQNDILALAEFGEAVHYMPIGADRSQEREMINCIKLSLGFK